MSNRDSRSTDRDALLPGTGYSPDYGINESNDGDDIGSSGSAVPPSVVQSSRTASKKDRVWMVAMCALIACLASLVNGLMLGFTSPTLDKLNKLEMTDAQHITNGSKEASLFGSFGPIGAMFGGLVAWPISELLGRQAALMLGGVPALAGWLMITYSNLASSSNAFLGVIYVGRLLTGFSTGWSIFCVSVYLTEIASARLKGLFGGCNQLFITIGGFIGYIYGVQTFNIDYWKFALAAAGIVALFEILMLFTYETPRWLFSKNKEFQAIRVLRILRGPNTQVTKEISQIKAALRRKYTILEQLKAFKNRAVFIPFILVLMLMFFQQFSGINAVIFYASDIFKMAQISIDVNLVSALAIGVAQMVATLISVLLVDKLGRKILLTISSIGMGLSSFVLGIYYYILVSQCENCLGSCPHSDPSLHSSFPCNSPKFGYLAIVCVVFFIVTFALAWGPIPWTMMSELMPTHVRTLAGSIATFVNWTFAAIITSFFHSYAKFATEAGAFWSFTVIMVLAVVLVIIFLPETKGHSLEEIQEQFENGHIIAISCRRKKQGRPRSSISYYSATRSVSVADA